MHQKGLSLVEVLVVIATIACLLALGLSGLNAARTHAMAAVCSSNHRQLLVAMASYDQTNGTLPCGIDMTRKGKPPGGTAGNMLRDLPGWWWFHLIGVRTCGPGVRGIIACPASRIPKDCQGPGPLYGQIGANWSICRSKDPVPCFGDLFSGEPCAIWAIQRPSQVILTVDSGYALIGWPHVTDQPPFALGDLFGFQTAYLPGLDINRSRHLWPEQLEDAYHPRHPAASVTAGWVDGHVDRRRPAELQVTRLQQHYLNLSPTWVPPGP